jgi:hypothetical protein
MAQAGEVREGSEHPDAGVLGQASGPKRTSLQRLARHFNVDVEQMRAAVLNWVAWGDSSTTIDVANAKPHKVFELTVDKRRLPPPELTKARWLSREEQRRWAIVAGQVPSDALAEALDQAAWRADQATTEGDQIRIGAWVYSRDVEDERRARTLRIIERAQPGPFENGKYLEILAREAAAIEMYMAPDPTGSGLARALERIILSTVARPMSHAATAIRGDGVIIAISTGLVDFMYQTAKSIGMALQQKPAPAGALTSVSAKPQDTAARLAADDTALLNFSNTLLNWLFRGTPWPPDSIPPPRVYEPIVGLLISGAERFIIGHEYGHALVDKLNMHIAWGAPEPTEREFRADCLGAMAVFNSCKFDRVKPNIALQGAVLAMKAQEIVDRAMDMARGGSGDVYEGSITHPPFAERLSKLLRFYSYLTAANDDEALTVQALMVPAETAEILWERVQPRLATLFGLGAQLHPVWVTQLKSMPIREDNQMAEAIDDGSADSCETQPAETTESLVVVDPATVDYVKSIAAEHGVTVEVIEQDGFTGIEEVMLVIAGVSLSVAFVNDLIDRQKGGQVFDLRPGALRLAYRSTNVQYGLVMIIAIDGKVTVEVKQPKTMFAEVTASLQEIILGMVKVSASALLDAARKALGNAATVSIDPE